jgi:lysophospholipase L1-like esterase
MGAATMRRLTAQLLAAPARSAGVRLFLRNVVAAIVACSCAHAQSPSPAAVARAEQRRDEWRKARLRVYMDDFGELKRFRAANEKLAPPAAGEKRVVFFGDSITEAWSLAKYFPGKPYVNRGIGGQTTSQLLVRFQQDVVSLRPAAVVILAGTNDIAGNTGPITLEGIQANFATLAELARVHGIRVVLSSIIPVHNYTPASELTFPLRPPDKIAALNKWLAGYCAANSCTYLDYAAAMSDERGLLKRELADDGLHPGPAGFAIMAPLAQQAITQALAR